MAIGRDFALHIEIIKQHEVIGQGVQVGRDIFRENAKLRVAVAFFDIAENLVVCPVLLDNINAMRNG